MAGSGHKGQEVAASGHRGPQVAASGQKGPLVATPPANVAAAAGHGGLDPRLKFPASSKANTLMNNSNTTTQWVNFEFGDHFDF